MGFEVERIDPFHFLAGCRIKRLNQTLSVSSDLPEFLVGVFCAVQLGHVGCFALCLFTLCLLVLLVRLSVKTRLRNDL